MCDFHVWTFRIWFFHVANAFQIDEVIWKLKLELRVIPVRILFFTFIIWTYFFKETFLPLCICLRRDIYAHELLYAGVGNLQMVVIFTFHSKFFALTMIRLHNPV
ncbi:hypothetical protein ACJX0J_028775 [Zea mays]